MTSLPNSGSSKAHDARKPAAESSLNFDQIKLERRRSPRHVVEELVTAVFKGDDRIGVTRLLVVDASHTGLGACSETFLEPGTRVTLTTRGVPMPHKAGTVVRCIKSAQGFLLGVRFDTTKTAA
jgi:hypothetical protein